MGVIRKTSTGRVRTRLLGKEGNCVRLVDGFLFRRAVGHSTRDFRNLGDPTPVRLYLSLNAEAQILLFGGFRTAFTVIRTAPSEASGQTNLSKRQFTSRVPSSPVH